MIFANGLDRTNATQITPVPNSLDRRNATQITPVLKLPQK